MPLKLSKYLYKNTFYNYAEQLIAVQESETLVTIRNQLSRIFDTEHGGTLSPHAQTFKVFRMHNRPVNSNLPLILHRFRAIAVDRSKIAIFGYPSCV